MGKTLKKIAVDFQERQRKNVHKKEYVYAINNDGPFDYDSEDEAIDAIFEEWIEDTDEYELHSIYRGEKVPFKASSFLDVYGFIERMQEAAYDEIGEYSDGWLENVNKEQEKDLVVHIDAWATKHGLQPDFYKAENIEELGVSAPVTKAELGHE